MIADLALQILWVAAHHGLRARLACYDRSLRRGSALWEFGRAELNTLWPLVHEVTAALGNPPAPGGPR